MALSWFWELVYPTRCVSCRAPGKLLCEECLRKLKPLDYFSCLVCGAPSLGGFTHSFCQTRLTPERLITGFAYQGPARILVKSLKYRGLRMVAKVMGDLMLEDLLEKGVSFGNEALVVPIPLSFWRRNERGFNQAELLGKELSQGLFLEMRSDLLKRVKNTSSQASLSKKDRAANVRGVFEVQEKLKKRDIILVDDVFTTGATAREAAKTLKKAGAGQVWVLTFARD